MNNQVGINITDNNTDNVFTNNIISLAKIVDNCYPDFDSQNFLSLMGVIYKQHSVDDMVQSLEVDIIRPNAYKLNTFQDFIIVLSTEQQKTTSKKERAGLLSCPFLFYHAENFCCPSTKFSTSALKPKRKMEKPLMWVRRSRKLSILFSEVVSFTWRY